MSTSRRATGAAVLRPELTEAVGDAVLDELAEVGYGRLSMQRVASRARAGKSALYRRWPGKPQMVIAAVARFGVPDGPPPDTGSLDGDLRALLVGVRGWLAHPRLAPIVVDLLAQARRTPELAEAFREGLAGPRRRWAHTVLERAGERGEVGPLSESEVDLVADVLGSVPFWALAVHGHDIEDGRIDGLIALLRGGISRA